MLSSIGEYEARVFGLCRRWLHYLALDTIELPLTLITPKWFQKTLLAWRGDDRHTKNRRTYIVQNQNREQDHDL